MVARKSLVSIRVRACYMDKSNGDRVETENCFTLGDIGVAVSGPEEATCWLAKLFPVERLRVPDFRFDRNRKYCRLKSQINNPKVFGRQKSTPGDLRREYLFQVEPEVVFPSSADVP